MSESYEQPSWRLRCLGSVVLAATLTLILAGCCTRDDGHHHYHPELSVPDGHEQAFSLFAEGVQIYVWTGTNWALSAPEAELYDSSHGRVGKHYKSTDGPTWEGADGSKVVGAVVAKADAYNSNSIPHLLLKAMSSSKQGTFSHITYIQRVDTVDGVAPTDRGRTVGQVARVGYRAEYVFYRKRR